MAAHPMDLAKQKLVIKELVSLINTSCIEKFNQIPKGTDKGELVDGNKPTQNETPRRGTSTISTEPGKEPSETGEMPRKTDTAPSETGTMSTETGKKTTETKIPSKTGTTPSENDTMLTETGKMPSKTGTLPSETGTMSTETGKKPSKTDKMPSKTGTTPSDTGTMSITTVIGKNITITFGTKDFHRIISESNSELRRQNVGRKMVTTKPESSLSITNECYVQDEGDEELSYLDSSGYSIPSKFQFFLCSSPNYTTSTNLNSGNEVNIFDEVGQYHQYEEFLKLFLKDPSASIENSSFCTIYKCTDRSKATDAIKDFLKRKAKETIEAVFIFLGHGSEQGFQFVHDLDWPLDDILGFIWNEFAHARKKSNLPACIKVVFACCFGHNHSFKYNTHLYQVISFTNEDSPRVVILYDMDKTNKIKKSWHAGLLQAAAIFQEHLKLTGTGTEEPMDTTDN